MRRVAGMGGLVWAVVWLGCTSDTAPPSDNNTTDTFDPQTCLQECNADAELRQMQYCGTDQQTYAGCQWFCGTTPQGVGVYPRACQDDGSPAANGPPAPADGDVICDWFESDGAWVAGECGDDVEADMASMAEVRQEAAGGTELEADETALPEEVDHRGRFGSIKSQGAAPTCIAFAATAGLEGSVRQSTNTRVTLSEMHLLGRYRSTRYSDMQQAIQRGTATAEEAEARGLGYDPVLALRWFQNRATPDAATMQALDEAARFSVGTVQRLRPPMGQRRITAAQLQRALANGNDLIVGFRMNQRAWNDLLPGGRIRTYTNGARFGHAVLLIGYRTLEGRLYFQLRNSWGRGWGDGGYGYIDAETAVDNLQTAVMVSAQRLGDTALQDCEDGQAAGLDGTCHRVCPDGSLADEQDQCMGFGTPCAAGMVHDSSGICVRGCRAGAYMFEGYSAQCGARGCTWNLTQGALGCTRPGGCNRFCPAPECELTSRRNEFGTTVLTCTADVD